MLIRLITVLTLLFALACSQQPAAEESTAKFPSHPDFKPSPQQNAMPKTLLVVKETKTEKSKFPAVDFHFHGRSLETPEDYEKLIRQMDEVGVAAISNMDGGFGERFDRAMEVGKPFADRLLHFARVNWDGINDPGWSEKAAAELERCFKAGAHGLKISKQLGLDVQNSDGSYVQTDDPRLDAVWEMCARYKKPVMMHVSDPVARFHPIGPDNERYEAGMWRDSPEGNYYGTDKPHYDEIFAHREKMLEKHPNTTYVLAHVASMGWDLERVAALLDKFPHANVEISARLQELGRQPYTARKFLIKYQDRVLFGTDGNPEREVEQFWTPHWRYFETDDEYFNHPAQMLSPLGAPLQGRWAIHGAYLSDEVIRKIYYQNALKYLPMARDAIRQ